MHGYIRYYVRHKWYAIWHMLWYTPHKYIVMGYCKVKSWYLARDVISSLCNKCIVHVSRCITLFNFFFAVCFIPKDSVAICKHLKMQCHCVSCYTPCRLSLAPAEGLFIQPPEITGCTVRGVSDGQDCPTKCMWFMSHSINFIPFFVVAGKYFCAVYGDHMVR